MTILEELANAALARRDTLTAGYGILHKSRGVGQDTVSVDSATLKNVFLPLGGKAADASGSDSSDIGVVSRSCTGNAATATKLATARAINGRLVRSRAGCHREA